MTKQITYQQHKNGELFDRNDFYPGNIPPKAGVYVFRDRLSKVIYVGKAANLRKRMSSYFQPSRNNTADPKLRSLIKSIFTYEYYPLHNESESLIFESRLIKEYSPRYNVLMRDDKRFLLVKINIEEQFPSLLLTRLRKNDGYRYFGPFPKTGALRKTIDFLIRKNGLRVCRSEIPSDKDRKHCLAKIVKDCCEPCIEKVSREEYMERVNALMDILNGKTKDIICEIRTKMEKCVEKKHYEKAAEYRDMTDNIEEIFGKRNRSFRFAKLAGTHNREQALQALQKILDLPDLPHWIECFDISNIGGNLAVASMVCFIDGKPKNSKYRRFRIRGDMHNQNKTTANNAELQKSSNSHYLIQEYPQGRGGDDFAMIAEAVSRRFTKLLADNEENKLPDLIIVDGGKGQLNAAIKALKEINSPFIPIIGLAKKNEEIFIPGRKLPIILDRHDPALKLLQSIRDESHRFAITYHRKLRDSRIEESILDDIPGIGPERKKALLKGFGSLKNIKKATPEKICSKVPGIGAKFAEIIVKNLSFHSTTYTKNSKATIK